jgi:SAM-dependent methyltransferase
MRRSLASAGYELDDNTNVWARPTYASIEYSDGDAEENRVKYIVENASDVSLMSLELSESCTDYLSEYHVGLSRANLLRPLRHLVHGRVLEIGAGCGAITRYLGECGAEVLALEGTKRRAQIARERCRDLHDVTVIAENFNLIEIDLKFDLITLIGVLEYAALFGDGDSPALEVLRRACSMLKPGGRLVIAIENQFGAKYLAGSDEDHLGKPMVGIEGYLKPGVRTFGRGALKKLILQAGFCGSEFFAPFPDYKLPVSLISEVGFSCGSFDAATLAVHNRRGFAQQHFHYNFAPELAWPFIVENGLGMDLANSFLAVASTSEDAAMSDSVLAYYFSSDRKPTFCKEKVFSLKQDGKIIVKQSLYCEQQPELKESSLITFSPMPYENYVRGRNLAFDFVRTVSRNDWSIEDVAQLMHCYLAALSNLAKTPGAVDRILTYEDTVPGSFYDATPANMRILHDETAVFFDNEWVQSTNVEVGSIVFRGLLSLMSHPTRFGTGVLAPPMTREQFVSQVTVAMGMPLSRRDIDRYYALDIRIQEEITGRKSGTASWRPDDTLPTMTSSEAIGRLLHDIARRDDAIIQLSGVIGQRDAFVARLMSDSKSQDTTLKTLLEDIENRDRVIAQLLGDIDARDGALRVLHHDIDSRDRVIAQLLSDIDVRDGTVRMRPVTGREP